MYSLFKSRLCQFGPLWTYLISVLGPFWGQYCSQVWSWLVLISLNWSRQVSTGLAKSKLDLFNAYFLWKNFPSQFQDRTSIKVMPRKLGETKNESWHCFLHLAAYGPKGSVYILELGHVNFFVQKLLVSNVNIWHVFSNRLICDQTSRSEDKTMVTNEKIGWFADFECVHFWVASSCVYWGFVLFYFVVFQLVGLDKQCERDLQLDWQILTYVSWLWTNPNCTTSESYNSQWGKWRKAFVASSEVGKRPTSCQLTAKNQNYGLITWCLKQLVALSG